MTMNTIKIPELLAPAGNLEKLKTAVHYGANAVYLGGKTFGLRAKAGNFSLEQMAEGVQFAHKNNVQVYVTTNIFAHNRDFNGFDQYLKDIASVGIDGVIVADPGVLHFVKKSIPAIPVHLSTQANITNSHSATFWFEQGVSRINLARELSFKEITEIRRATEKELEVFVHGALCISYSGRCMLSNYMTNRDANKGQCSHPCRFSYSLLEEKRPGEYFPVEEDLHGTYIFNSKDLCLLQVLPKLVAAGVDSLKIEGRMKSIFYVGGVVRVYRAALDYLSSLPARAWQDPGLIRLPDILYEELQKLGTRGVTENFFLNPPTASDMLYESSRAEQFMEPVAVITGKGEKGVNVEVRNTLFRDELITVMGKDGNDQQVELVGILNDKGALLDKANPGNLVTLLTSSPIKDQTPLTIIRRFKEQQRK